MQLGAGAQPTSRVRFDWGPVGTAAAVEGSDVAVVVDVLSFTTTLSVAADCGIDVVPCPWSDERAKALGREHNAVVAVSRSEAQPGQVSLSPESVRRVEGVSRLVLPSPNGSTISAALAVAGCEVIAASFRNRGAVVRWLLERHRVRPDLTVAVIAAGERWPDGTLRPAVEDLWGAGAVVAELATVDQTVLSPEAGAAAAAWRVVAGELTAALHECVGGQELIQLGYRHDVDTAAELDSSTAVPRLGGGIFTSR